MKTAKVIIASIRLVCPECLRVVTASDGQQVLRDENVADRWEQIAGQGITCNNCFARFSLPKNPFKRSGKELDCV
jgi:hypothetical protein